MNRRLRVLAVDDVPPALDELCQLLREAPEVREAVGAGDAITALRLIQAERFDAVFLDIAMPGLSGLELGALLERLADPPVVVFVTAFDQHAVQAYGVGAVDYLLKPIGAERLAAALARVQRVTGAGAAAKPGPAPREVDTLAALPVETAGRTHYVRRSEVQFVEAHGDYVRLHTAAGQHMVRIPISRLQEYWEHAGFVRVHRGFLVAMRAVRELRSDSAGGLLVHTDVGDVPVSRRHARELKDRLLEAAKRGELGGSGPAR
ncbi:MAG TPA: LytTR family DNA-binding domain-containing protein [Pseudonocardiaceae bacterium]|nr:LytTR family DNA-binding domain-containing protein [Pseudonocardiaceae bacterium]